MDIEVGNAAALNTNGTGWFIGFSDWTRGDPASANLRYMPKDLLAHTLHMKWMSHPANDDRGTHKPPSEGRTISILVSERGAFRIEFSSDNSFNEEETVKVSLSKHGDFVSWGEDLNHRWFTDEQCTIVTLRWIPVDRNETDTSQASLGD